MTIQHEDKSDSLQAKIEKLEESIHTLLNLCKDLSTENATFRDSNNDLMQERSELQLKNDKVRTQVEAMVERLKTLDKAS